jgi:hypothetical protein
MKTRLNLKESFEVISSTVAIAIAIMLWEGMGSGNTFTQFFLVFVIARFYAELIHGLIICSKQLFAFHRQGSEAKQNGA